ncbi:hypothetical protein [Cupriavidus alkaliphilus]|uniref:hypothetical protein n=1 Tax=Cupriavidus alkaliphilus TaxID=942866 RepID=UPI00161B70DB|nr:hypothetical protein [Cupriavidus alkaliphilus]MBB3014071.1 hypothetical protein [Cupriavidus alkaliphilus]
MPEVGQELNELVVYDAASELAQAIQKAGDVNDTAKVAAVFRQAQPMKSAGRATC